MIVPFYLMRQDLSLYNDFRELMKDIDTCAMWRIPVEREKIQELLRMIYAQQSFEFEDIITEI